MLGAIDYHHSFWFLHQFSLVSGTSLATASCALAVLTLPLSVGMASLSIHVVLLLRAMLLMYSIAQR